MELSVPNPVKRTATTVITSLPRTSNTASPQPENHNDSPSINGIDDHPSDARSIKSTSAGPRLSSHPTRDEIASRTIALMNIPDTVNDARIRALVEPYGELVKITLRHDHQGAIVEFKNVACAGKAELELEGMEIVPGRKVKVGAVAEMMHEKAEYRSDRIGKVPKKKGEHGGRGGEKEGAGATAASAPVFQPAAVRRPGQGGARRGGRGGLGFKKGTAPTATATTFAKEKNTEMEKDEEGNSKMNGTEEVEKPAEGEVKSGSKSNADFKKMFLKES